MCFIPHHFLLPANLGEKRRTIIYYSNWCVNGTVVIYMLQLPWHLSKCCFPQHAEKMQVRTVYIFYVFPLLLFLFVYLFWSHVLKGQSGHFFQLVGILLCSWRCGNSNSTWSVSLFWTHRLIFGLTDVVVEWNSDCSHFKNIGYGFEVCGKE